MSNRTRCLVGALATCVVASGCGGDQRRVKGNPKPVKPGAVRKALDATDLQIRYRDLGVRKPAAVTEIVAGEVIGSDGASRAFAVWVVDMRGSVSAPTDRGLEWTPKIKGHLGGTSGCGSVLWAVGYAGSPADPEEGEEWGTVYTTIDHAVCELVYGKGVLIPGRVPVLL